MKIKEILGVLEIVGVKGDLPSEIKGIVVDSRKAFPGSAFIAVKGEKADGHRFLDDARRRGSVLFIVQEDKGILPEIIVPETRLAMARLANEFYGRPSQEMTAIGITGTNGKTTTAHLLRSILGRCVAITTIGYYIDEVVYPGINTTPDPITLNEILRKGLDLGINHCVMEVSSHSIVQKRIQMIDFDYGIFTCLSRDHLDYHKSFEDYKDAKANFFRGLKKDAIAIINHDDPNGDYMIENTNARVITYGITGGNVRGEIVMSSEDGLVMTITGMGNSIDLKTSLKGSHNAMNILAAVSTAMIMGVDKDRIVQTIEGFHGVRGRMEPVDCGQPFRIYIDYAHTPDAMARAISSVREFTEGMVIVLFGAGGERDRGKRPLMGRVASKLADTIIITSDNPRSEDPDMIMEEIAEGIDRKDFVKIKDRGEAIEYGIKIAKRGDTLLLLGKGHEEYQEINGEKIPFSDLKYTMEILRDYGFDCG